MGQFRTHALQQKGQENLRFSSAGALPQPLEPLMTSITDLHCADDIGDPQAAMIADPTAMHGTLVIAKGSIFHSKGA